MCVDNAKLRALSMGCTIFSTMDPAKPKNSFQSNEAARRIEAQLRASDDATLSRQIGGAGSCCSPNLKAQELKSYWHLPWNSS